MLPNHLNVLLVEDNPGDARLIREMLANDQYFGASYVVEHAVTLQAAVHNFVTQHFDVILLDLNLPDSMGISTIQRVSGLAPETPIVVLTGWHDELVVLQAARYGAQDYILKNECSGRLLKRVIHYAIERKTVEERFRHLATHDPLTGLPNRLLFYDRLGQALHHAERNRTSVSEKGKTAVILMDLNGFKRINDTFGHEQGDEILQLAASRLKTCLRESDTIARLGGDEFVLTAEGLSIPSDCVAVAQKLLNSLNEPTIVKGQEISLSASMGISIFPDDAADMETLIRYADTAMYAAKRQNLPLCFYQDGIQC